MADINPYSAGEPSRRRPCSSSRRCPDEVGVFRDGNLLVMSKERRSPTVA